MGSDFSSFYAHLMDLLTPFSQARVDKGLEERPPLPELQILTLGDEQLPATATPISARKLATFVGTRLASWGELSSGQVSSIAAGDLSQVDQEPQGTPFSPDEFFYPITILKINVPLEVDDETLSWLEKKVPWLQVKHRIA